MLTSDKPQPSPEFPGTRSCVELHQCFLAYLLYLFDCRSQTALSHHLTCSFAFMPLNRRNDCLSAAAPIVGLLACSDKQYHPPCIIPGYHWSQGVSSHAELRRGFSSLEAAVPHFLAFFRSCHLIRVAQWLSFA